MGILSLGACPSETQMGNTGKLTPKNSRVMLHILLDIPSVEVVTGGGADKTLVSWVTLANTTQQGGSAVTIQSGSRFDGIVFGEKEAGRWMAGSKMFSRTQGGQQASADDDPAARPPTVMPSINSITEELGIAEE